MTEKVIDGTPIAISKFLREKREKMTEKFSIIEDIDLMIISFSGIVDELKNIIIHDLNNVLEDLRVLRCRLKNQRRKNDRKR